MNNEIRTSLKRVSETLNAHNVRYMIIGGVAVAFYGFERTSVINNLGTPELTHDLDFWYEPTTMNYTNLVTALKALGIDTKSLDNYVFDPAKTYLRIPFGTFRTEFLPQMKGLDSFSMCLGRARKLSLDGNTLFVIGYEDLILNKKSLDREIDRRDIEQLHKRNPGSR